jgi:hypothetical protein
MGILPHHVKTLLFLQFHQAVNPFFLSFLLTILTTYVFALARQKYAPSRFIHTEHKISYLNFGIFRDSTVCGREGKYFRRQPSAKFVHPPDNAATIMDSFLDGLKIGQIIQNNWLF